MDTHPDSGTRQPASPAANSAHSLSVIRHELRTPINHLLGYCEMLMEEESCPMEFMADLRKIHAVGKQMLSLITEFFGEETWNTNKQDPRRLNHELRTPVNQIAGYTELLEEMSNEKGLASLPPDLRKIRNAAFVWLQLMEQYLITPNLETEPQTAKTDASTDATATIETSALSCGGRLLVADDDPLNRDLLARRLSRQGYQVTLANNGQQALQLIHQHSYDLILLDMIMPGLDGRQVLAQLKSDPGLSEIPVIMISAMDQENGIARCIEAGAEDYISKPVNPVFLRARIGACIEKRRLREKERQTYQALVESQKRLAAELAEAASYVRSLLPQPLDTPPIQAAWRFQPSVELGGDAFGYQWIDEHHFVFYLLDVCGHGTGSALLSVSILNAILSQSLPATDFADPASVMLALNRAFTMEKLNFNFFTIWYGVFDSRTRQLTFASAGHPPAVLVEGDSAQPVARLLTTPGIIVDGIPGKTYCNNSTVLPANARLYLFSDGLYELMRPDGRMAGIENLVEQLILPSTDSKLDDILHWAQELRGGAKFEDDISILELMFHLESGAS